MQEIISKPKKKSKNLLMMIKKFFLKDLKKLNKDLNIPNISKKYEK